MEVFARRGRLHLTVSGPGHAMASYDFPDRESLLAFARNQERELGEQGFQLQAVAERRSGDRGSKRPQTERRRVAAS